MFMWTSLFCHRHRSESLGIALAARSTTLHKPTQQHPRPAMPAADGGIAQYYALQHNLTRLLGEHAHDGEGPQNPLAVRCELQYLREISACRMPVVLPAPPLRGIADVIYNAFVGDVDRPAVCAVVICQILERKNTHALGRGLKLGRLGLDRGGSFNSCCFGGCDLVGICWPAVLRVDLICDPQSQHRNRSRSEQSCFICAHAGLPSFCILCKNHSGENYFAL